MFKSFFFLLSAVCAAVIPIQQARAGLFQQFSEFPEENYKLAAVCFAGSGDCGSEALFSQSDQDMSIDSGSRCMSEGYQKNLCSNGQTATAICPYNKEYEKDCRCPTGLTACSEVQTGSGKSCVEDGITKYETCSCKNTLITCSDVQDGVGEECGGKYASCQCKTGLVACENNQEGVGEECGGKYASCQCPQGWTTCEDGGDAGAKKCTLNGVDYFSSCKNVVKCYKPAVGDILYSDLTTCGSVLENKVAIGVVFYVDFDQGWGLAAALKDAPKELKWSNDYVDVPSLPNYEDIGDNTDKEDRKDWAGKDNTKKIVDYLGSAGPAAYYCYNYSTIGTRAHDWFMASYGQLVTLQSVYGKVNKTLTKIGGRTIGGDWRSSSTEFSKYHSTGMHFDRGSVALGKGESPVRPILQFSISAESALLPSDVCSKGMKECPEGYVGTEVGTTEAGNKCYTCQSLCSINTKDIRNKVSNFNNLLRTGNVYYHYCGQDGTETGEMSQMCGNQGVTRSPYKTKEQCDTARDVILKEIEENKEMLEKCGYKLTLGECPAATMGCRGTNRGPVINDGICGGGYDTPCGGCDENWNPATGPCAYNCRVSCARYGVCGEDITQLPNLQ